MVSFWILPTCQLVALLIHAALVLFRSSAFREVCNSIVADHYIICSVVVNGYGPIPIGVKEVKIEEQYHAGGGFDVETLDGYGRYKEIQMEESAHTLKFADIPAYNEKDEITKIKIENARTVSPKLVAMMNRPISESSASVKGDPPKGLEPNVSLT